MEEFQRHICKGFIIERINLCEATIREAISFKRHLETDMDLGYRLIIIDLSICNTIDPAFLGALVVISKQLLKLGGNIKIVKPGLFTNSLMNITGTIEKFEIYESLDQALNSISKTQKVNFDFNNTGLELLAIAR